MTYHSKWRIIGSVAARHWFPDFKRVPLDIDLLTSAEIVTGSSKICVVDCQWHAAADAIIGMNRDPVFLDADLLFTLKISHAHWNIKWQKTMFDVNYLKSKGCSFNREAYDLLFAVWEVQHGKKRVNLNQPVEEFFTDAVVRIHDHEDLHELVKFNARPMHEYIRPNHGTAFCSEKVFSSLTLGQQHQTVLEELLVTAIERSGLTSLHRDSQKTVAVYDAYLRLCTSMTTGWFARFLILNRVEILSQRSVWITKLNTALEQIKALE